MKYKVTKKCGICQILTDCRGHNVFDCLECVESVVLEKTDEYTQEEYLNLLKRGNVFITKVDVVE